VTVSATAPRHFGWPVTALWGVLALTAVVYVDVLTHPFEHDDFHALVNNQAVHGLSDLHTVWTSPRAGSAEGGVGYRPVLLTFWAVEYAVFGDKPWGYHLVSLFLHLAAVGLTWSLMTRLSADRRAALAAAALVALHPMHAEAVNYVTAQASVAVAVLQMAALLCATAALARRGVARAGYYGGALATAGLALGVKETAVMFPVLLWLWEWYRPGGLDARRRAMWAFPFLAVVAAFLALRQIVLNGAVAVPSTAPSMAVAAGTTMKIIALSLGTWIWPFGLSIDHGDVVVSGDEGAGVWLIGAAVVLTAAWWMARRGRRTPFFLLGWAVASLLPVGAAVLFIRVALYQENRAYLAGVGIALALAPSVVRAVDHAGSRWGTRVAAAMVILAVGAGAWVVAQRTHVWGDRIALWRDAAGQHPDSAHAYAGLGGAYRAADRLEEAEAALRESWRLDPNDFSTAYALGDLLMAMGRRDEGMAFHQDVVERVMGRPRMEILKGDLLLARGDVEGAGAAYRAAQAQGLETPELFVRLGSIHERAGRTDDAMVAYRRALEGPFAETDQDRGWKTLAQQGVARLLPPRSGSSP